MASSLFLHDLRLADGWGVGEGCSNTRGDNAHPSPVPLTTRGRSLKGVEGWGGRKMMIPLGADGAAAIR
eukprot:CAMPEP_0183730952 /NCGR_PEP_ID=MMETSP0737-20130205/33961_1 /TAXON_ID=385413 /ORGANISM="Thalassiosira miniscula, Strain CCMP1093" /LENGTH=68 /DNA_ID=CAMNT_0025963559 /DNA_START=367 /DNA_END=573 /DNA_ORIENTATION=-